ncbi:MAG: alpha-1,2-fucosyltransferase [Lachnospiraceae bacterium]|nr:alpha-1,2-fucosyltransferase [Lachnospiraceae bacterium]
MIIIRMSGGLERQMFQYALYLKLTSMGREVKFDDINEYRDERTQPIMLSVFDIDYPRATWEEINRYTDGATDIKSRLRRVLRGKKTNIYREQGFYDPKVFEFEDVYLDGKFMSQKYFEDILPLVHQTYRFPSIGDLKLAPRSDANFLIYYNDISKTDSVGIHVRRSDSRFNEELYENICTPEYYTGAIRYILERVQDAEFYVFSNEPKWIKGWLKGIILGLIDEKMSREDAVAYRKRFHLVQANDEFTSYLDLFLLSQCRHNILSNSSFSWWGTWLNKNPDRISIAPNMWLNGVDSEEIYTEGMVLINAKGRVERRVK